MNEGISGETIWRGRFAENGPPMRIVENAWGQFLQEDTSEVIEFRESVNEPRTEAGMLF